MADVLEMREPFEPAVNTRPRLSPWIVVGIVVLGIVLLLLFVSFVPSANAAGGCGGG